jgi:predicted nucleotidyltransferase
MTELMRAITGLLREIPLKINSAVLFGSLARGEDLPWSDVDLLLISKDFSGMRKEDRIRLVLDKWDYMRPLEPICLSPDEISEENPLIWEICMDGIPVVDDGTFRELKKRCIDLLRRRRIERRWYGYVQMER